MPFWHLVYHGRHLRQALWAWYLGMPLILLGVFEHFIPRWILRG